MKTKEVLCAQAALILWKGRKAIHQPGLSMLQSKCILEQDDVNRMQVGLSGFLSKRKRGYEEKLEKEMAEVAAAKEELERMQKLVAAADEKLPILELRARACTKEWEEMDASLLRGEEKEIYQWCQEAKKCVEVIKGVDLCIAKLKEMQANSMTVQLDSEPFLQLQKQIDLVWINAGAFVKELGEERQYDLSFRGRRSRVGETCEDV